MFKELDDRGPPDLSAADIDTAIDILAADQELLRPLLSGTISTSMRSPRPSTPCGPVRA